MEFYTYVNIFETKGLEYLLLLAFLVLFIFLLRYLAGPEKASAGRGEKRSTTSRKGPEVGELGNRKPG